jgi:hypothetical protein
MSLRPLGSLAAALALSACVGGGTTSGSDDAGADASSASSVVDESDQDTSSSSGADSTNDGDDPQPDPSDQSDQSDIAEDPGSGAGGGDEDEVCTLEAITACDGADVVELDPCSNTSDVVETCESECFQGRCTDCIPTSGVVCQDGNVHQVDSCGVVGRELEACSNGCSEGACISEDCTPRAGLECGDQLLWEVDSCGNRTNVADVCEDGCAEGACVGCEQLGDTICFEGNIHTIDSCGVVGQMLTDCEGTCSSVADGEDTEAMCVDDEAQCMATEAITCLGDIRAVDSCGNVLEEVVEDCPNGCDEMGCLPCEPRPVGLQCVGNDVHRTIGGCDDPAVPEPEVLTMCEFACSSGECTEDECVPNAGSTCSEGDVYATDSCEQLGDLIEDCPGACEAAECVAVDVVEAGVPGEAGTAPEAGPPSVEAGPADSGTSAEASTPTDSGAPEGGALDGG